MRLSDILLFHAEACLNTGRTEEAAAALEAVRFRARGNVTYNPMATDAVLPYHQRRQHHRGRHLARTPGRTRLGRTPLL